MAVGRPPGMLGLNYVRRFTHAYRQSEDQYQRETLCEDVQFPAVLVPPRPTDYLVGKRLYPEVGYSLQYGGLGYYADFWLWDESIRQEAYSPEEMDEWKSLRSFWEQENTSARCVRNFSDAIRLRLPKLYNKPENLTQPALPLFRMGGLQLDFGKLVANGISGLEGLVKERRKNVLDVPTLAFLNGILASLARVRDCLEHYHRLAKNLDKGSSGSPSQALCAALDGLLNHPPRTFHEALQLILLITTITGSLNFGRLDVVLGPFLRRDLEGGGISWEGAKLLMQNFYTILEEEILHFDARIIVGGRGRPDESSADLFAMLALETTESLDLPLPQLSLRFFEGQNPALLEKAYDVIGQGKTFPMVYNDDVNVPAVEKAFGVSSETARHYLPFGCGEYMIDHQSCGTPNAIINLQRCLESALNQGKCLRTGEVIGPDFGDLNSYSGFEELWEAYARTVEYFVAPLALAQDSIYRTVGAECPYSLVSLLYDDCVARGRSLFAGGIRYLGGTNETYGNTNAADSLTAIEHLVFKERVCSGGELLSALRRDWAGAESLRGRFQDAPKFGNDHPLADRMAARVHRQICLATSAAANGPTALHHFLVVIINNDHNTHWGKWTSASADGRKHGEPLAPGNAAGAGHDKSGLTAVLNSQAKTDPSVHAGAVQNVRLSACLPSKHRPLYHALFNTYFQQGGAQAMVTVVNRKDLLEALAQPERYANLLVRVGGFSARFIDLDPATQQEILSRTEHGS